MAFYSGPIYERGERKKLPPEGWYELDEFAYGDYPGIGVVCPHRKFGAGGEGYALMELYRPGPMPEPIFYRFVGRRWVKLSSLGKLRRLKPEGFILPAKLKEAEPPLDISPPLIKAVGRMIRVTMRNGGEWEGRLISLGDFITLDDFGSKVRLKFSAIKGWKTIGG